MTRPAAGAAAAIPQRRAWRLAVPLLVGLAVLAWLQGFPVQPALLGAGLLASALLVAWRPWCLWWLVGLALPSVDLAPWSGRLALDEFDALLALVVAVAWWRLPAAARGRPDALLQALLLAVGLSFVLSTGRALLPWAAPDADAFVSLFSPYNALRVARGAAWAFVLLWLAKRQQAAGWDVVGALGNGLVLGLAGTVGFIVLERLQFTTLLDFADGYRVAGPFSAMHTGGAYIECFLVVALPFLLARLRPPVPAWRMVAGAALLLATVYAVMVTFSRSGYTALAVALAVSLAVSLMPALAGRLPSARLRTAAASLVLLGLSAAVAWPVLSDTYAQSRLQAVDRDLVTRQTHWAKSLDLINPDALSLLLGMGVGRFPAVKLLHSPADERSASYRLVDAAGERFVRLGAGQAVYIEQLVHTLPGQRYSVRVRLRAAAPGAVLGINLCEKSLITSATCAHTSVKVAAGGAQWLQLDNVLDSAAVGRAEAGLARPIRLGFQLLGPLPLDLAEITLLAPDGSPLLRNGDFAQGMDHWFFTADHHLAWHAKSLPVALAFDQGALGLLALGGLLVLALARAGRAAWAGQAGAVPLLAALAAFCTVAVVDTLIDAPRFLMLWLLLCGLAAAQRPAPLARRRDG